jgi:hypothetical protein
MNELIRNIVMNGIKGLYLQGFTMYKWGKKRVNNPLSIAHGINWYKNLEEDLPISIQAKDIHIW